MYRKNRGFTMIEVVISIAVLAIAATALLSLMETNYNINARAARRQQINMLTQEWMEKIRMYTEPDLEGLLLTSGWTRVPLGMTNHYTRTFDDIAGTEVRLEVEELDADVDGIEISPLPQYHYKIEGLSSGGTIEITGGGAVSGGTLALPFPTTTDPNNGICVLLYWSGSGGTINVENNSGENCTLYVVMKDIYPDRVATQHTEFPDVKIKLGKVKVNNYIVYSLNEMQKLAIDLERGFVSGENYEVLEGSTIVYKNAYKIRLTAYIKEGSAAEKHYTDLESYRIVR